MRSGTLTRRAQASVIAIVLLALLISFELSLTVYTSETRSFTEEQLMRAEATELYASKESLTVCYFEDGFATATNSGSVASTIVALIEITPNGPAQILPENLALEPGGTLGFSVSGANFLLVTSLGNSFAAQPGNSTACQQSSA